MRRSSCAAAAVSLRPLLPLNRFLHKSYLIRTQQQQLQKTNTKTLSSIIIRCRSSSSSSSSSNGGGQQDSSPSPSQQQQLNLSVLRFTFGIPGLDESYLPRWIGYAFGSLLLLNHFVGSDSSAIAPAQLRTEILGLSLAAFSVLIPYLGKFLRGATPVTEKNVPEGAQQIFIMSPNISDALKEDLAWGTYILLRNTNTVSMLISIQDALCVRGYWNIANDISKDQALECFNKQIQQIGLSNLEDTLYFPRATDSELREMLPKGTRSLLVQPLREIADLSSEGKERNEGYLLLASTTDYAYSEKDIAWIGAIANKFRGSHGV